MKRQKLLAGERGQLSAEIMKAEAAVHFPFKQCNLFQKVHDSFKIPVFYTVIAEMEIVKSGKTRYFVIKQPQWKGFFYGNGQSES